MKDDNFLGNTIVNDDRRFYNVVNEKRQKDNFLL